MVEATIRQKMASHVFNQKCLQKCLITLLVILLMMIKEGK